MSRPPCRLRLVAVAAVVASSVAIAAAPIGGVASAASQPQRTVHHANLHLAVRELPGYVPGVAHWSLSASMRHYGTTNWDTDTITISAFTPVTLLYSVVAHEWSHELQAYDYHHKVWRLIKAMNHRFGGGGKSGQRGVEYSADCMAILQGARWTGYTACNNNRWRHAALRLLTGHRLKARHRHHRATHPATTPSPTTNPEPDPYPAPGQYSIDIHR